MGEGQTILFELTDEQRNPDGYEYECKNCRKKGRSKTDRKKYCDDSCRYEYNAQKPKLMEHEA